MRSRIAVLALASTALAAPAYRPSCSYSCPTRDARGGQLIAGIEFFGQLQCSYLTGMCTYSTTTGAVSFGFGSCPSTAAAMCASSSSTSRPSSTSSTMSTTSTISSMPTTTTRLTSSSSTVSSVTSTRPTSTTVSSSSITSTTPVITSSSSATTSSVVTSSSATVTSSSATVTSSSTIVTPSSTIITTTTPSVSTTTTTLSSSSSTITPSTSSTPSPTLISTTTTTTVPSSTIITPSSSTTTSSSSTIIPSSTFTTSTPSSTTSSTSSSISSTTSSTSGTSLSDSSTTSSISTASSTTSTSSLPTTIPPASNSTLPANWSTLYACAVDPPSRIFATPEYYQLPSTNTPGVCAALCSARGYPLAAVEYGYECFCAAAYAAGPPTPASVNDCNMPCAGDASQMCGGSFRVSVFTGPAVPSQVVPPTGGGGVTPPVTTNPVFAVTSDLLPTGWAYNSCWVDNAHGRIFTTQLPDNANLTVQSCVSQCGAQNFTLAGVEYGTQCFCGNSLVNGPAIAPSGCNMACGGNSTQSCGGSARLSVYSSAPNFTTYSVPSIQKTGLPPSWNFTGCYIENSPTGNLPYRNVFALNNTVDSCLSHCAAFGYPVAGLEFGQECWCGDLSDIQKGTGSFTAETSCQQACSGDPSHVCGDPGKLLLYSYEGDIDTWHTPAVTGRYEFLIGSPILPLVATVGINNKVTFLEKTDSSHFQNSSHAYELDLTLTSDNAHAWRQMHVKSDIFCSAALVLPDKAGRLLNIGGWSLASTQGIRMYTPDGVEGTNGTNDWEENWPALHLQRPRWYPTAIVLTNGSVLVVGGEIGSNLAPEPTLEILPAPAGGPTYLTMDWLLRTDPNNLYPFLIVLPSSNIFVGYYNEARILDSATFDTISVLPNMPGNVNNFLAGRSYPMEGSAVVLPQRAPYTDPLEVLVCGGSTPIEGTGLDSCISIAPEVPNATWVYERMPSKRVMPCIAALPDGTYLIVNGAHQGHAGFGLASSPNLQAVLYDPSLPVHSRFSILNDTIVARMYHSEATLLPDGRVLISGSDPNDNSTGGMYPEEFRIEVYFPPYLSTGLTPPTFSIAETDWVYGGAYVIDDLVLFQGDASTVRVSLIAATSSTHGNTMGGRTIFPDVSCDATGCTVTAPPNAGVCPPGWFQLFVLDGPTPSHSQWVRIGGDPGELGNWPNLPGFTVPGM